jgi:hypothetical protein
MRQISMLGCVPGNESFLVLEMLEEDAKPTATSIEKIIFIVFLKLGPLQRKWIHSS